MASRSAASAAVFTHEGRHEGTHEGTHEGSNVDACQRRGAWQKETDLVGVLVFPSEIGDAAFDKIHDGSDQDNAESEEQQEDRKRLRGFRH